MMGFCLSKRCPFTDDLVHCQSQNRGAEDCGIVDCRFSAAEKAYEKDGLSVKDANLAQHDAGV